MRDPGRHQPTPEEPPDQPTDLQLASIMRVAREMARSLGANRYEADDVAQATTITLWAKWNHPNVVEARNRPQHRWFSYVKKTAKNKHVDRIRGHQRRLARESKAVDPTEHQRIQSGGTIWLVPTVPSCAEALAARAAVNDEIKKLPPRQRAIAEGALIREMSNNEIASQLGIQPQSVRKHLRAAIEALREGLAEAERQQS